MVDFERIRAETFAGLALTNSIEKINVPVKSRQRAKSFKEIWKVVVEIPLPDKIQDFQLLLELKKDFPLTLPKIFLTEEDYEFVKYIPHVDTNRFICLFDQENLKIDINRPLEIVKICLSRAAKIIQEGLTHENNPDFRDELIAYWENRYSQSDKLELGFVADELRDLRLGKFAVFYISPPYTTARVVVGSNNVHFKQLLDLFKLRKHRVKSKDAFYLGDIQVLQPPFFFDHRGLLNFLNLNFSFQWKEINKYLNSDVDEKLFIFSIQVAAEPIFFGFYLGPFKKQYRGWRSKSLDAVRIMSTVEPSTPVTRVSFKLFNQERFTKRTDGVIEEGNAHSILVAGLGSIGSNLIHYLSALNLSKVVLVDPDVLTIENVNRHLLSFDDVGNHKVNGIAKYLKVNFPFVQVDTYPMSLVNLVERNRSSISQVDIMFIAIGKNTIEEYVVRCLNEGKIFKPVVVLWIEPFLLGAHVLYLNPGSGFELNSLDESGNYKFNVISAGTYSDPLRRVMLREAGCQTSYTPYGREAIALFYSMFLPTLFAIVKQGYSENRAWTYFGDLNFAADIGIDISEFARGYSSNQLISHTL